jgi:hypothetical protein
VRRRAALLLAAAALLGGCGAPSADLFAVDRSGADRNANVRLVVNDGGTVTCNGREHTLPSEQLLDARALARDLADDAKVGIDLAPGADSVLSYRVRTPDGDLRFSDTSRPLPKELVALTQFTKDVTEDVCGIERG